MTLLEEMQLRLDRFTYKPRHRFTLELPHSVLGVVLVLSSLQPHVDDPNKEIVIQFRRTLYAEDLDPNLVGAMSDAAKRYFDVAVEGLIHDFEAHEMAEWLKFDGKCVREPHPELKGDKT